MNTMRFLFDENIPWRYLQGLRSREPAIDVRQVGNEPDAPAKQTSDLDVLIFAEREGYTIVTFDLETFPRHAREHIESGRNHPGVFGVPKRHEMSVTELVDEIIMIWAASEPNEWLNKVEFLPLKTTRW
jgi:hypothetical protein